jgi:ABC-2 type transport system permease protein
MRMALVVASRELRGFLRSPLGFALLAVYALVSGIVLVTLLRLFAAEIMRVAQQAQMARPGQSVVDIQVSVVTPYFLNVAGLLVFLLPFLTMRSLAEEKRTRSLELLVSYPLSAWQIVAGKYMGLFGFALLLLGISGAHMGLLFWAGSPAPGPVLGGLGGLLLLSAALIAIGLFVSSLSSGQVEAAVLTLGLLLMLVLTGEGMRPGESWMQTALAHLSPLYAYQDFGRGVLSLGGVLGYLATVLFFVGLTLRGLDLLKWRG